MDFKNTEVFNFEGALRGMRNPLNSWDKSDSKYWLPNEYMDEYKKMSNEEVEWTPYHIGENDMNLAQRLIKAGSPHRKFMRQIFVSVDITASLYWWKEMDTYKVGTTANSTSTMHKLSSTPITRECFEMDDFDADLSVEYDVNHINGNIYHYNFNMNYLSSEIINKLERLRQKYLETKDIRYWKELIRWLPESWLQTRTWTCNYETLRTIYFDRRNHKLSEWNKFCNGWISKLPYAEEFITWEN